MLASHAIAYAAGDSSQPAAASAAEAPVRRGVVPPFISNYEYRMSFPIPPGTFSAASGDAGPAQKLRAGDEGLVSATRSGRITLMYDRASLFIRDHVEEAKGVNYVGETKDISYSFATD